MTFDERLAVLVLYGQALTTWINEHNDKIETHRQTYQISGEYYNHRYRKHPNGVTTEKLIKQIQNNYLKEFTQIKAST